MLALLLISKSIIERGLIYGILVIATYISSRIIKFENMSLEGSFGLGGALSIVFLNYGINCWLALILTFLGGAASSVLTGLLYKKLNINPLISGVIVTTGLFSLMLKIAGANAILKNNSNTIFNIGPSINQELRIFLIISLFTISVTILCQYFLKTEIGLLLYAGGENEQILINIGKNATKYKLIGLGISNGLAALSHGLLIQYMEYFSIWFSAGMLVTALAGMVLAELFCKKFSIFLLLGGIIYQAIIALTFEFDIHPDWNKLITATLIIIIFFIKNFYQKESANARS